jgi:hypothetical protein
MPKETITNPSEGGLVRLKYTFRFGDQFIEPDDDWLKCVENTSDELLGAYSKSEDNALSAVFGNRKKKRLNRVFDAIGFVYPDYRYPPRRIEEPSAMPKTDKIEEPRIEGTKTLEVLSPSAGVAVPKAQKDLAATPKRKRMASVLDVLETIKASSSSPGKIAKASKVQIETETKLTEAEATMSQASAEAGPSEPAKEKPSEIGEKVAEEEAIE